MIPVDGGVCAPKGFRASGVAAGIKVGSTKKDCALILSEGPASLAGMFTTNVMKSPPVYWNQERCKSGTLRGVFLNSGNANAATGDVGHRDVAATAGLLAHGLDINAEDVCLCSTGVIGVPLPMDRIERGVADSIAALTTDGSLDAAEAIMTTDTVAKEFACEVTLSSGTVRLGAIAKGSGMISPNMATMICIVTTDASAEAGLLGDLLRESVSNSFNQVCVDNDMSTSDTVLLLANGASESAALSSGTDDCKLFAEALTELCRHMAQWLVRDGEGATKFVEIVASGTTTDEEAKSIARAIGNSQLCKTAFFGEDPNWGRFACAAGYAGVDFDPANLDIFLDDLQICKGGLVAVYEEEDAAAIMQRPEFRIAVSVGDGSGEAIFWTSDLSRDYVSINADYRS